MRLRDAIVASRVVWRTFGARGVAHRMQFETRKALGGLRSVPSPVAEAVGAAPLPSPWPFQPDGSAVRRATPDYEALQRGGRALGGEHQAYRFAWRSLPGSAREWYTHPESGYVYDATAPWFRIPHLLPAAGDVKDMWEPARFAWAYDLARAWLVTADERYALAFWQHFERFLAGCPPFRGVQWSCGQEVAIRALAWLWTEGALLAAPCSTPARLARLRHALAWSAERIEDASDYAQSQRNNHGLSEATGLVAIGARMAGADPRAWRWIALGSRLLEREVMDQFEPDGWYIQHSFNYARLALDQVVMAERALRSLGRPLTERARTRIRAAVRLLAACVDAQSGEVPLHGANDGAYVLPLSTRPYRDFLPALTAAAATFDVALPGSLRPDEEVVAWLGADPPARDAMSPTYPRVSVGISGWAIAETEGARLFARAGSYRSRPGHIDALHVDVWLGGTRVATDAGTYRYTAREPWHNGLAAAEVHNTITLPGRAMARRGPRFLWLSWPAARVLDAVVDTEGCVRVVLENHSWRREGIVHRRTCEVSPGGVIVIDEITTPARLEVPVVLQWLLDGPGEDVVVVASGTVTRTVCRGEPDSVRGWVSEHYSGKRPATSVRVEGCVHAGMLRIVSGFGDRTMPDRLEALAHAAGGVPASCLT